MCLLLCCASTAFAQKAITKPVKPVKTTTTTTVNKTQSNKNTQMQQTQVQESQTTQQQTQTTTQQVQTTSQQTTSTASQQTQNSTQSTSQSSKPTTGTINGHEYVDLGLSVKWATCNIGANSPSEGGNYYAWGETTIKSSYTEENSVTYKKNMHDIVCNPNYDAARANWGGSWRLPTEAEIYELVNKCSHTWTTMDGHKGYKVTGPNGNSIFLPVAGYRRGSSSVGYGSRGYYWSSSPNENDTGDAYYFSFDSGTFNRQLSLRYYGKSVRPVSE